MENIWWKQVTNAVQFIEKMVETVQEKEKHVALELPENMPWYDTMIQLAEEKMRGGSSERKLVFMQGDEEEAGKSIFLEFCSGDKQTEYNPAVGYAAFLAKSDDIVLNERIVWISGIPRDRSRDWMEFVSEYASSRKKKGGGGGIFILELQESAVGLAKKKGVQMISFHKEISRYDSVVFNMLAASSIKEPANLKEYLAELISNIAGSDIELGAQCVRRHKEFLTDPYQALQRISLEELRSSGKEFNIALNPEEVKKQIWKAQIKIIFPLIEEFRGRFVDRYQEQIRGQLPIPYAFGEEFTVADEVEVGTLYYMACHDKIHVSRKDYDCLKMFREARNDLAHLSTLSQQEMKIIFDAF